MITHPRDTLVDEPEPTIRDLCVDATVCGPITEDEAIGLAEALETAAHAYLDRIETGRDCWFEATWA